MDDRIKLALRALCVSREITAKEVSLLAKNNLYKDNRDKLGQLVRSNGVMPIYKRNGMSDEVPLTYEGTEIAKVRQHRDGTPYTMVSLAWVDYKTKLLRDRLVSPENTYKPASSAYKMERARVAMRTRVRRTEPTGLTTNRNYFMTIPPPVKISKDDELTIIQALIDGSDQHIPAQLVTKYNLLKDMIGSKIEAANPTSIPELVKEFTRPQHRTVRGARRPTIDEVTSWSTCLASSKWMIEGENPSLNNINMEIDIILQKIFKYCRENRITREGCISMLERTSINKRSLSEYMTLMDHGNGIKLYNAMIHKKSYREIFHPSGLKYTLLSGAGKTNVKKVKTRNPKGLFAVLYTGHNIHTVSEEGIGTCVLVTEDNFLLSMIIHAENSENKCKIATSACALLQLVQGLGDDVETHKTGLGGWRDALNRRGLNLRGSSELLPGAEEKMGIMWSAKDRRFKECKGIRRYAVEGTIEHDTSLYPCIVTDEYSVEYQGTAEGNTYKSHCYVPLLTRNVDIEHVLPAEMSGKDPNRFVEFITAVMNTAGFGTVATKYVIKDFSSMFFTELISYKGKANWEAAWLANNAFELNDFVSIFCLGLHSRDNPVEPKPGSDVIVETPLGPVIFKNQDGVWVNDGATDLESGTMSIGGSTINFGSRALYHQIFRDIQNLATNRVRQAQILAINDEETELSDYEDSDNEESLPNKEIIVNIGKSWIDQYALKADAWLVPAIKNARAYYIKNRDVPQLAGTSYDAFVNLVEMLRVNLQKNGEYVDEDGFGDYMDCADDLTLVYDNREVIDYSDVVTVPHTDGTVIATTDDTAMIAAPEFIVMPTEIINDPGFDGLDVANEAKHAYLNPKLVPLLTKSQRKDLETIKEVLMDDAINTDLPSSDDDYSSNEEYPMDLPENRNVTQKQFDRAKEEAANRAEEEERRDKFKAKVKASEQRVHKPLNKLLSARIEGLHDENINIADLTTDDITIHVGSEIAPIVEEKERIVINLGDDSSSSESEYEIIEEEIPPKRLNRVIPMIKPIGLTAKTVIKPKIIRKAKEVVVVTKEQRAKRLIEAEETVKFKKRMIKIAPKLPLAPDISKKRSGETISINPKRLKEEERSRDKLKRINESNKEATMTDPRNLKVKPSGSTILERTPESKKKETLDYLVKKDTTLLYRSKKVIETFVNAASVMSTLGIKPEIDVITAEAVANLDANIKDSGYNMVKQLGLSRYDVDPSVVREKHDAKLERIMLKRGRTENSTKRARKPQKGDDL